MEAVPEFCGFQGKNRSRTKPRLIPRYVSEETEFRAEIILRFNRRLVRTVQLQITAQGSHQASYQVTNQDASLSFVEPSSCPPALSKAHWKLANPGSDGTVAARHIPGDIPRHEPWHIPRYRPSRIPRHIPRHVPRHVPRHIPRRISGTNRNPQSHHKLNEHYGNITCQ